MTVTTLGHIFLLEKGSCSDDHNSKYRRDRIISQCSSVGRWLDYAPPDSSRAPASPAMSSNCTGTGESICVKVEQSAPGGAAVRGFLTLSKVIRVVDDQGETPKRVLSYYIECDDGSGVFTFKCASPVDAQGTSNQMNPDLVIFGADNRPQKQCGIRVGPRAGLVWADVTSEVDIVVSPIFQCHD
ncbi:MAG: hypothetical protein AMXMBFR47_24370 [Planctomycetota bacterium]